MPVLIETCMCLTSLYTALPHERAFPSAAIQTFLDEKGPKIGVSPVDTLIFNSYLLGNDCTYVFLF